MNAQTKPATSRNVPSSLTNPTPHDDAPPEPSQPDTFPPHLPGWNAPRRWTDDMQKAGADREAAVAAVIAELSIGDRYAALINENRTIRKEQKRLRELTETYEARRRKAREADVADAAAASRRGEPDPGDNRLRQVDDEHTANLRRHDVLSRTSAAVDEELRALAKDPGLAAEIDARLTAERASASIALASLEGSLRRLAAFRAVNVWTTLGGERKPPTAAETMVPLGDGVLLPMVVAALGQLVE